MDEPRAIRDFLAENFGHFCDDCLGKALGIHPDEVKTTVFVGTRDYARVYGECRACRRRKAVTRTASLKGRARAA
jgi:hypothetical protein